MRDYEHEPRLTIAFSRLFFLPFAFLFCCLLPHACCLFSASFLLVLLPPNRLKSLEIWVRTETMMGNYAEVGKRLRDAGDEMRANSKLKSSESFVPVPGLLLTVPVTPA
jgi:hypothetical protein